MRLYHLLLILLQFQFISLAHGATNKLSGSINFNAQTINEYVEHSSLLAADWKMDEGGNSFLVPGNSHQQYGSSAFKISPKFKNSKLKLIFFPFSSNVDLGSCNFYMLANQRALPIPNLSNTLLLKSLELDIPTNTDFIEIGILPRPEATFNCNLKLLSITVEQRSDSTDLDDDGVNDDIDNCPAIKNPKQLDNNFDAIGDSCTLDRTKYFSNTQPAECQDSAHVGPDNDADGISDLCDPDDDNDTISDINELHWQMDVFKAFDFDIEKETDHDKDGLLSSDEIEYGYSPFIKNNPPTVKLDKYFLNHKNSSQTPNPESNMVYQYTSINNQTFSFGSRYPNYHFELNKELLLTGASLVDEAPTNFKYEFQPAIRVFPSPVLIGHEYEKNESITAIHTDNTTGETVSTPVIVRVISKVALSDNRKYLGFNYLLNITNKNTSKLILQRLNEPTVWNENEGIVGLGELNNYTPLIQYIPPETKPKIVNTQPKESSNSSKSGGAVHLVFLLTLLSILRHARTARPYLRTVKKCL